MFISLFTIVAVSHHLDREYLRLRNVSAPSDLAPPDMIAVCIAGLLLSLGGLVWYVHDFREIKETSNFAMRWNSLSNPSALTCRSFENANYRPTFMPFQTRAKFLRKER